MKEEMMAELIKQRDLFLSLFDEKRHDHLVRTGQQSSRDAAEIQCQVTDPLAVTSEYLLLSVQVRGGCPIKHCKEPWWSTSTGIYLQDDLI